MACAQRVYRTGSRPLPAPQKRVCSTLAKINLRWSEKMVEVNPRARIADEVSVDQRFG